MASLKKNATPISKNAIWNRKLRFNESVIITEKNEGKESELEHTITSFLD